MKYINFAVRRYELYELHESRLIATGFSGIKLSHGNFCCIYLNGTVHALGMIFSRYSLL